MEDRFKFRAWSDEYNRYLDKVDIYNETLATDYSIYTLLEFYVDSNKFTFEQCTGLKDKNGKLIYEGDIVETHDYTTEHSQIVFDKGCYVLKSKDVAMYEHLSTYQKKCKIIGNIHENLELLGENKDAR